MNVLRSIHLPARVAIAVVVALGLVLVVVLGLRAAFAGPAPVGQVPVAEDEGGCGRTWVAAWGTAQRAVYAPESAHGSLDGRTVRLITRMQADGDYVRVVLSNRYGSEPLEIGSASAGVAREVPFTTPVEATLVGLRPVPLTFGGATSVTIGVGEQLVSDPAPLDVNWQDPLAISLFLPGPIYVVAEQDDALQTSYLSEPGDFTADGGGAAFTTTMQAWPVLAGVEVRAPRAMNSVLLMGDSLTEGVGSGTDLDDRFSDALTERITAPGGSPRTTVINSGLAGSELLADAPDGAGDSPQTRLGWELPRGATDVILQAGNNDIAAGRSAREITDAMTRFIEDAQSRGVRVYLTTITPATAEPYGTPQANAVRQAVNDWVRSGGAVLADGWFDFAQATDDAEQPTRIGELLDSGDGIHLSAAGYRALARAVDLSVLGPPPCP